MRVFVAMDSFKGNLSSLEVAAIVEKGIKKVFPSAYVIKTAIADGGEGTVDAIIGALNGTIINTIVKGPLGDLVNASYGIAGNTAVIEMAQASGLVLIPQEKRNPMLTSTYGTGQLIMDALEKGCKTIVLGIGGSATNDGGCGMAKALGIKFLDADGKEIKEGGGHLDSINTIDMTGIHPDLENVEIHVACDVDNPLCGERGASHIFGPQKGADNKMIKQLDSNLKSYADKLYEFTGKNILDIPGTGAAGGLGAGLLAFCNAKLIKGIDIVLDTINIEESMKKVDIVITGEGRIDRQTAYGKVPVGVAGRAVKQNKPVYAIAGFASDGYEQVYNHGIDAVLSSMVGPMDLDQAIKESPRLIEMAAENLFRILKSILPENY